MSFEGTYAVLDVESGSVHAVDKIVYDLLNNHVSEYTQDELYEAREEIDALKAQGMLDSPCLVDENAPVFHEPVVKAMCLHIAHDCNLRCKYCFAHTGDYRGERGVMPIETARAALLFLMERSGTRYNLEVDFFGGEPLLNFEVVKAATEYGRELEKQYHKNIRFTMTTNALAVTPEMQEFLNREMKNLVISIDGRQEIHDAMRPDAGGRGSYARVLANAKKLVAARSDKEYYIRGTYTAKNPDFAQDVLSIVDEGFDAVSVEPVVTSGELALSEEMLPRLFDEYDCLARQYEQRRKDGRPFTFFHFMVDLTSGPCLNKRLRGCGAGSEYVAVTPSGEIYPCHQFAGQQDFLMGNVFDNTFDAEIQHRFCENHVFKKESCRTCWAKYYCSGGCAANAYFENGDIGKPHKISCELEKKRLELAIMLKVREMLDA